MIQLPRKIAIGSAHGKLILVGEHAVVYGMPAIALPFPLIEVKSTVEEISETIMIACEYYDGPLDAVPMNMIGIATCIKETLKFLNKSPEGLLIRLHSTIPLGRGLGSSAAVATAIVRSIFAFYDQEAHQKELLELVNIAETHAHGNPSGIDMNAVSSDFPIWFQKGEKIKSLQIGVPLHLVVADTGRVGDTYAAVNGVREKFKLFPEETQQALDQLKGITIESRNVLSNGDVNALGRLLDLAQDELITLGVSDVGINQLVDAARKAGALGSKLTGGGRGGCVLALAYSMEHAKELAKALLDAGACNSWYFTLENK